MKFYKKGDIEGRTIVEVILAIIIIIGTFSFFAGLVGFFIGGDDVSQITLSNFDGLTKEIENLVNSEDISAESSKFPFQLEEGYVLVGFNRGTGSSFTTCDYTSEKFEIPKPLNVCGEEACLCIFSGVVGKEIKQPVKCKTFSKIDIFYGFDYRKSTTQFQLEDKFEQNFRGFTRPNPSYSGALDIVIFGRCDKPVGGPKLGVIELKLGKKGDGKHFFIDYEII